MTKVRRLRYLVIGAALIVISSANANQVVTSTGIVRADDNVQVQSTDTTLQSFIAVEGADLMGKLEAAHNRARLKPTPYWSAYAFDVRPGVAIDPAIREFNGSINRIGDTSVFIGTTSNGIPVETRNLAIFLLRDPTANQITRMEIYNLERKREYSGYPVYWLGRANNEESLNYLRALAAAAPLDMLSERAVLGIALHDDGRVAGMLKNFVTTSQNPKIRSSAIYWLGQVGSEQAFLAGIVRNESEDKKFRRLAAYAIGQSHDRSAITTLKELYDTVKDVEIHRSVISGAGNSVDQALAYTFLITVVKTDADWESRRVAVRQLDRFRTDEVVDELMKIFTTDTNIEVKKAALRSLGEIKNPHAQARLMEIARTEQVADLRRQAIRAVGERGETAVDDLLKLYDAEQTPDTRRTILQSLAEIKSPRVENKLFEIAKSDNALEIRRQAIRLLGELATKRSFEFLSATAQSTDGNGEVQVQAVRAISDRRSEETVPLLIKIARSHPNPLVRKQAIRSLADSGDPRAVDFFREVLTR